MSLSTLPATTTQFHHRANIGKTGSTRCANQCASQLVIIDMHRCAADVTDQEDAIMAATGMAVGQKSVGAFDPARKVCAHEQVKYTIDAVGCYPFTSMGRNGIGYVIGRNRLFAGRKGAEYVGTHVGPLFAGIGKCLSRRRHKPLARMFVMMMARHYSGIGGRGESRNQPVVKPAL